MSSRPAAGGGRWVPVAPQRLTRWIAGFSATAWPGIELVQPYGVLLRAEDGATAELHAPPGATSAG